MRPVEAGGWQSIDVLSEFVCRSIALLSDLPRRAPVIRCGDLTQPGGQTVAVPTTSSSVPAISPTDRPDPIGYSIIAFRGGKGSRAM